MIPLEGWPERDRRAWAAALAPASLFDDRASLARYGTDQVPRFAQAYGRWLGYLGTI